MKNQIKNWLASQKDLIEEIICDASKKFIADKSRTPNFLYDLAQCQQEAMNLSQGKDLCYDRYTMGMFYSLWYQGRRLNTSLTYVIDFIENASSERKPLEIFDLGAGTGAVQIAVGLCLEALSQTGQFFPDSRVINVDISPFMLDFNRSYLWPSFASKYPSFRNLRSEFTVNSWTNPDNIRLQTPYIVASYLFDHQENKDEIAGYFKSIVDTYQPEKLVLVSSNQLNKKQYLDVIADRISGIKYHNQEITADFVYDGSMHKIQKFRAEFNSQYGDILSSNVPQWGERGFYARQLTQKRARLALNFEDKSKQGKGNSLDLYQPSIRIRKEIILNPQQIKAAELSDRPTVITGPAGCGKSIVITERIKNLCKAANYSKSLRILLTTFNKNLIGYLAEWLSQILDPERVRKNGMVFFFDDSNQPNIQLFHFDVLPTRIGRHLGTLEFDSQQKIYIQESIDAICKDLNIDKTRYSDILDPYFLYMEYIRVIYGQQYDSLDQYQKGVRRGRPLNLRYNDPKRELIWKVNMHYLARLERENKATIYTRRHKLLRDLKSGYHRGIFTHLFVDEFQDCTQADYDIFYGLVNDNNQLVLAGDYAQAVHLGKSASPPREGEIFAGNTPMRPRLNIKLDGSYRLPFRISECIKPFSAYIKLNNENDTDLITPYKGAPPGSRPIVIYANSTESMKIKILWCVFHYQIFDIYDSELPRRKKITILEADSELSMALNQRVPDIANTSTVLKMKGMENDCIVWSTRKEINDLEDIFYYIYTILTRTCSILIIALFDNTPPYAYDALSKMNQNLLLFWDKESRQEYSSKTSISAKSTEAGVSTPLTMT